MDTLYYEIEGIKSVDEIEGLKGVGTNYDEVEIPENVISLNAVRKKDGIFLQYITASNMKIVWAQDIIKKYSGSLRVHQYDGILGISFVELSGKRIGFSRCSKKDSFNPVIGKAVAICRATGEKVPDFI